MQQAYGTWSSPISAPLVAAQGLRFGGVAVWGDDIYWLEGRPAEGGRTVLVSRDAAGRIRDLTPDGFNVRTRVHEYGGGAYTLAADEIFFSNFGDQRIYRMPRGGGVAAPLTPAGPWFYADGAVDAARRRLICVREDHATDEPLNTLVSIPLDEGESAGAVIASGHDFYSTPRISPDGARLCWLAWRHPQMPWDGTELWTADLTDAGVTNAGRVAGGATESIYQPGWSPDGTLYFVSDREGWWRLYRALGAASSDAAAAGAEPVLLHPPDEAEFGRPQWTFGTTTWAFAGRSRMVVSYTQRGRWQLAEVDPAARTWRDIPSGLHPHEWLSATATGAVLVAGSPTAPDAVVRVDLATGAAETIRSASALQIDPEHISAPEPMTFADEAGEPRHAFYYAPHLGAASGLPGERPPLIAISHGGPTASASATLDLKVQFWTSRGFAVVDVNYGGSSGYGRAYREALNGAWGIVDVADVVRAAQHLVAAGKADPDRLIVRGGSAGGYTTLAALTFHPHVFKAGASYYGISDIEALVRDTHKFESRYLDTLVGPYPEMRDRYRERSPLHFVDRVSCPLILFQGLEDRAVPPNQSGMMADAVRRKGLPVAYLTFAGEQHGFRKAETIVRCLEAELYFYGAVFGCRPADTIEPVAIENLGAERGATH